MEVTTSENCELMNTEMSASTNERHFVPDEADDFVELRDPEPQGDSPSSSGRARNPLDSVFGEVSIFRDFFLAAFSDGYNTVTCCGSEGFFPGSDDGSCISKKKYQEENLSRNGSVSPSIARSPSGETSRKRRKKPLAVAVGFNYANDFNGRPIVITPGSRKSSSGSRRSPLDRSPLEDSAIRYDDEPTRYGGSRSSSPPQLPVLSSLHETVDPRNSGVTLSFKGQT